MVLVIPKYNICMDTVQRAHGLRRLFFVVQNATRMWNEIRFFMLFNFVFTRNPKPLGD